MNMSTSVVLAAFAAVLVGSAVAVPLPKDKNSPEYRAALRENHRRFTGGMITDTRNYKGQFLFLNSQALVKPESIAELTVGTMSQYFGAKFGIVPSEPFTIAAARELMRKADAQAAVFLVDDPVLPALLAAPEENWTLINVRKLAVDNPAADLLGQRTRREMWRALAYTLGCKSPAQICVLRPVNSLKDLDKLSANALSQYPLSDIKERLPEIGIGSKVTVSYRRACQEGWAPAPTNELQKAVWDKVHEVPAKPMKIEFDAKKGR